MDEEEDFEEEEEDEPLENIIEETLMSSFSPIQGSNSPSIEMNNSVQELESQMEEVPITTTTSKRNDSDYTARDDYNSQAGEYEESSVQMNAGGAISSSLNSGTSIQPNNPFSAQSSSLKPHWETAMESGNKRKDYQVRTEEQDPLERDTRSRRRRF